MGDSDDSGDNKELVSSSSSSGNGNKNKRKYLSEFLSDKFNTLSVAEFPRYEVLEEKVQNSSNEVGVLQVSESDTEEQEIDEWTDPIVCEVEALLSENLHRTFERAILKMVELGYNKDIAEQTFLKCGLYHSTKDTASNAVEGALIFMNKEKELETSRCDIFSDFDKLVDYTLIEMVSVLKEVRPGITVAEALWILLICDLNLLHACVVNGNHLGSISLQDVFEEVSRGMLPSKLKPDVFEPIHAFLKNVHFAKSITPSNQSSNSEDLTLGAPTQLSNSKDLHIHGAATKGKESPVSIGKSAGVRKSCFLNVSKGSPAEEKSTVCRKGSFGSSKREMLRQKLFHVEKCCKGRPRGAFKTKVPWSGVGLDKPPKLPSSSSSIPMKSAFSEISPGVGANSPLHEGNSNVLPDVSLSVPQAADAPSTLGSKGSVFALPSLHAKTPPSLALESEPTLKTSGDSPSSSEESDCCGGIPSDECLGKFILQDEKDKCILTLSSHLKALQKEIQGWNEWAKEKVMQATQRLSKDQGEIKMLKLEKVEAERIKNDKQGPEDSSLKRISEIENAINNTTDQLAIINSTIWSLDKGNSELRIKLEAAKKRASAATANLKEALLTELEAFKRSQAIDKERIFLKEELTALKHQAADMRCQLEKTEERKTQLEVVWNQEEREKQNYLAQAEDIRRQTEQQKAKSKGEENRMRETAASKSQSRDQYIKKLTDEISQRRLSHDHSKIAELLGGFDVNYGGRSPGCKVASAWKGSQGPTVNKRAAVSKDNFGGGSIKPERECVMCLTEEMTVLFFPCAHQVLCEECNVLHEKQGMNDCPSCRTPIQERIYVRFQGY